MGHKAYGTGDFRIVYDGDVCRWELVSTNKNRTPGYTQDIGTRPAVVYLYTQVVL